MLTNTLAKNVQTSFYGNNLINNECGSWIFIRLILPTLLGKVSTLTVRGRRVVIIFVYSSRIVT